MTVGKTIKVIKEDITKTLSDVLKWFEKTQSLMSYISGTTWSIEQILEHIALTNHYLLILVRKGQEKSLLLAKDPKHLEEALQNYKYNLDELNEIAIFKSFTWVRPEHMEPKGDLTRDEVKDKILEQMNECLVILERLKQGEGILYKTKMTVNNLGKIDVYQYIYFLIQHTKGHIAQMKGIEEEHSRFEEVE
ncbi:DinB family protein [Gorillibacterium sp. sgz5001074]|uniref:DinB family protein n=1 Tax=Gorillibacterium sp. sgz5001074 TaxID=3446695 RepID=UPI003F66C947